MRPLDDASLWRYVLWTMRLLDDASFGRGIPVRSIPYWGEATLCRDRLVKESIGRRPVIQYLMLPMFRIRWANFGLPRVARRAIRVTKKWFCDSYSDYPPPVCVRRSGHIGQGRIVQGKHRPRDASSKGRIVQGTHRPRDASSKNKNLHSGTHRSRTHCHDIHVTNTTFWCQQRKYVLQEA
jgi:hypothetical protein